MLKSLSKSYLIVLLLLLCSGNIFASHFAAADVYVEFVGRDSTDLTYKVTLTIYRACEKGNSTLFNPFSMTATSVSCGITGANAINFNVDTTTNGPGVFLDELCPVFHNKSQCYDATSIFPAFERWIYSAYVTLPLRCSDWVFDWTSGARNAGISNLFNPGSANISVSAQINNSFRYDVSSPRFTVDPIPYLCENQPATFFNGPSDKDGDSIVTVNKQPIGCSGSPYPAGNCDTAATSVNGELAYDTGYTFINPIKSSTGYSVSENTGLATFTPTQTGKFVLAFRLNKYDPYTGTFLGYTTRDVQVSVLPCSSPPPTIDSTPLNVTNGLLGKGNIIIACANVPLAFDIHAQSQSNTNAVYMACEAPGVSGYNFTVGGTGQGTASPVGTFGWTPTSHDIGTYIVRIIAVDSSCTTAQPIVFKSYLVVTIKVVPGVEAYPKSFNTCAFGKGPTTLSVKRYPAFTYEWTTYDGSNSTITDPSSLHPSVEPGYTTPYIVTAPNLPAGCKDKDTVIVYVDTTTRITIDPVGTAIAPVIFCQPGLLHLNATVRGFQPYLNLPCGLPDTATLTHDHDSTAVATTSNSYSYSLHYGVTPFSNFHSTRHQYLIKAADLLYSGMFSSSLTGIGFKVDSVTASGVTYDTVTISLKCTTTPLDTGGAFASGTTQVFSGPVTITKTGYFKITFNRPYNWDTTQDILVDVCISNRTVKATTFVNYYNVGYRATVQNGSFTGSVCAGAKVDTLIKPTYVLPDIQLYYDHAPLAGWSYRWEKSYGSNLLSDSTAKSPDLWVSQSSKYLVYTKGRSRCAARDSVYIYLDEHSATINPLDTSICVGRSVLITVNGGMSYKWYQHGFDTTFTLSCLDCAVPIAKPFDSTRYTVVISDSVNCADTLYSNINVLALPVFTTIPRDTTIKYGASIRLHVSNDTLNYVWSPISTLDDPYSSAPVAKPFEPTIYTVVGTLNNCSWTDTVKVGIDYSANLLVPSVFSPNHDGKNDRFRVAGLTFQKIIEFRVFNRMGQELYNATDNVGWDGTWNNVEQDIDTYFYFIRVAYPDGFIQNFKGDVTLLR